MNAPTAFDVDALRRRFPALQGGTAFFDGPGGSQTPQEVADAVAGALTAGLANRGSVTAAERAADDLVVEARAAVADLLGADAGGVVFGRSMTQLTFDLARCLARTWAPGDEVVVTTLDHDANIRPWVLAAEAAGATVRWAEFDPGTGELDTAAVERLLSERTRLVAVTGASNLIGTQPPVAEIARAAHRTAGAVVAVDGVHLTAHEAVDVTDLGADMFTFSPYKLFGPHCGVLAATPALLEGLHPDKLLPSTEQVPERFELGTLPYELLAGVTSMVDVIASIVPGPGDRRSRVKRAMGAVAEHEDRLRRRIEEHLGSRDGVRLHSRASRRTPTVLATFDGRDAAGAHRALATAGVNAPAGSFYALLASERLGLGSAGGLRMGVAPYTNDEDVDRLLARLDDWLAEAR